MCGFEEYLPRSTLRSKNDMPEFQTDESVAPGNHLVDENSLLLELTQPDIVVCPHPLLDITRITSSQPWR